MVFVVLHFDVVMLEWLDARLNLFSLGWNQSICHKL